MLETSRFWPLLVVVAINLVGHPLASLALGPLGEVLLTTLLWCGAMFVVSRSRWLLWSGIVLAVLITLVQTLVARGLGPQLPLAVSFHVLGIVLVGGVGLYLVVKVINTSDVTTDTVLGGVCVYLMLGVLFALLYSLTEVLIPGSFRVPEDVGDVTRVMTWMGGEPAGPGEAAALSSGSLPLYFSFTTLTTLGYGDIAPRQSVAQSLTSIEAVVGQLYLAVLIARLVAVARPLGPRGKSSDET